jgi:uncharacterized membrane protein YeaQ/YmgE (transglycosylase-associated protein family)
MYERKHAIMKKFGIALIVLGCIGLFIGHMMFGDIGVSCTYSAIIAIVTGTGFIKIDNNLKN